MISHIIACSILVTLQNGEIISQKAEYKLKDFHLKLHIILSITFIYTNINLLVNLKRWVFFFTL